jgi:hypothetical protein
VALLFPWRGEVVGVGGELINEKLGATDVVRLGCELQPDTAPAATKAAVTAVDVVSRSRVVDHVVDRAGVAWVGDAARPRGERCGMSLLVGALTIDQSRCRTWPSATSIVCFVGTAWRSLRS